MDMVLKGGRRHWLFMLMLLLFTSVLEGVSIGVIFPFIKIISDPTIIEQHWLLAYVYQVLDMGSQTAFLVLLALVLFLVHLFKSGLSVSSLLYGMRLIKSNEAALSRAMLWGYLHGPYETYIRRNTAELIRNVNMLPQVVFGSVMVSYLDLATELFALTAITVTLVLIDPLVTSVVAGILGLFFLVFRQIVPHRISTLGFEKNAIAADLLRWLHQSFGAAKEIKILGREGYFRDAYGAVAKRRSTNDEWVRIYKAMPRIALEVIIMGVLLLSIVVVLVMGRATADVIALMGVLALAALRSMSSFTRILSAVSVIKHGSASIRQLHVDYAQFKANGLYDDENAELNPVMAFRSSVSLEEVSYSYPDGTVALECVSMRLAAGETLGVVGSSGAGKSTLVNLLTGLLQPHAGHMSVDGLTLSADDLPSWRRHIGYVPQMIYLLDDSLRRNIAIGLSDDRIDDQRIWEVLRLAQLDKFVGELREGLDSACGENGIRLSGGQRQRIGIARALYHDPELLVFDEATSALDNETEREFTAAINGLAGSKTMVIIAHRLSTVRNCDRLIVMERGHVIAEGSFDALMESNQTFRNMVNAGQDGIATETEG